MTDLHGRLTKAALAAATGVLIGLGHFMVAVGLMAAAAAVSVLRHRDLMAA